MLEHVPATREAHGLPAIEAAIEPHVERIQAAAADAFAPNTRRAYRTAWAAFASVMRDAMLRRSEAAALEWADVELRPDGSGRLTIRRSKTD